MSLSKPNAGSSNGADVEGKIQSAIEVLHKLGGALKVDTVSFTFHPEQPECDKLFSAYFKKQKYSPTYSNVKTIGAVGGKILYTAVAKHCGLQTAANTSGCSLWYHRWSDTLKCYHGEVMCKKKNEIEMPTTSEAGAAALKEGRGIVETNRWGKPVVKIVQDKFVSCMEDMHQKGSQYSATSCGLTFTDHEKARMAMWNSESLTGSVFPNAKMEGCLFMPVYCECNPCGKIIMGRQLCKAVPFALSGTEGLKETDLSPMQAISVKYPAVFVFQCCNSSGGKGRGNSCDFKISYPDLLQVLVMVRKMWTEIMGAPMSITFPRFKWSRSLRVQSALLPEGSIDEEQNPFGIEEEEEDESDEVPDTPPKKRTKVSSLVTKKKKKKQIIIEESSDEDEED